jgi:adenylate kinase
VQKILGHASINTTRRYAETLPEKIKELAVEVFYSPSSKQKEPSLKQKENQDQTKKKPYLWIKWLLRR